MGLRQGEKIKERGRALTHQDEKKKKEKEVNPEIRSLFN